MIQPQPQPRASASLRVVVLVQNVLNLAAQHASAAAGLGGSAAPIKGTSAAAAHLRSSLAALSDPSVLALATDCLLAELLQGLQALLVFDRAAQQWAVPGLDPLLSLLQQSCQVCAIWIAGMLSWLLVWWERPFMLTTSNNSVARCHPG